MEGESSAKRALERARAQRAARRAAKQAAADPAGAAAAKLEEEAQKRVEKNPALTIEQAKELIKKERQGCLGCLVLLGLFVVLPVGGIWVHSTFLESPADKCKNAEKRVRDVINGDRPASVRVFAGMVSEERRLCKGLK